VYLELVHRRNTVSWMQMSSHRDGHDRGNSRVALRAMQSRRRHSGEPYCISMTSPGRVLGSLPFCFEYPQYASSRCARFYSLSGSTKRIGPRSLLSRINFTTRLSLALYLPPSLSLLALHIPPLCGTPLGGTGSFLPLCSPFSLCSFFSRLSRIPNTLSARSKYVAGVPQVPLLRRRRNLARPRRSRSR